MFSTFQKRFELEVFASDKIIQGKALIYIHEYKIQDIDDYGSELEKE